MYQVLPSEVLAGGAVVALSLVGWRRRELAPATGAVGGAIGAWLAQSLLLRDATLADVAAGAMMGSAIGVIQRGEQT